MGTGDARKMFAATRAFSICWAEEVVGCFDELLAYYDMSDFGTAWSEFKFVLEELFIKIAVVEDSTFER